MNAVAAIIKRNLLNFFRDRGRLLGTVIMPLFFLFAFSFVTGNAASGISQPMNYLLAGIIVTTVFQGSISNSTAILTDIAGGFMKEILVAPISRTHISAGHIAATGIIATAQGVLLAAIGLIVGLRPTLPHAVGMLGIMMLAGVTFGSIGLFLATLSRNSATFQIVTAVAAMPFMFLSGAFIPTVLLPHVLLPLVYLNPLTYLTASFRYIALGMAAMPTAELISEGVIFDIRGFLITPTVGLTITAAVGALFLFLCVRMFDSADFSRVRVAKRHH